MKYLLPILILIGPALLVLTAISFAEPADETPEPFWDIGFYFVMSTLLISAPQIIWAAICLPGSLSKEVYWGGLIAAQAWLITFGIGAIFYVRSNQGGDDVWFIYFPPLLLLMPVGAFVGFLVHKLRHKKTVS